MVVIVLALAMMRGAGGEVALGRGAEADDQRRLDLSMGGLDDLDCLGQMLGDLGLDARAAGLGDEMNSMLDQLADPESGLSRRWDQEHDRHVTNQLLEQIRHRVEPTTWEAFRRGALLGQTPAEAEAALGVTVNVIFISRSRVLSRLREEGAGLID